MRIDDKNMSGIGSTNVGGAQGAQEVDRARSGGSRSAGGGGQPDQVQLSGLAEQLQALQPGSEAREAELNRLKELVQTGRYQVDAEQVSEAMVEDALRESAAEAAARGPEAARES
jgi:negative regulator of flagellin synthesis FlgM